MQTFLPYKSFEESAACLDYKRLGKQRVEAYQILRCITAPHLHKGWGNHPAVRMWRRYEGALRLYGYTMCMEWVKRGYKDGLMHTFDPNIVKVSMPEWLGYEPFHLSHRKALLEKDYDFYRRYDWQIVPEIDYFWPSKSTMFGHKE